MQEQPPGRGNVPKDGAPADDQRVNVNLLTDRVQHLDARVILVIGFDQDPGRYLRASVIYHIEHGFRVLVPFPPIAKGQRGSDHANSLTKCEKAVISGSDLVLEDHF